MALKRVRAEHRSTQDAHEQIQQEFFFMSEHALLATEKGRGRLLFFLFFLGGSERVNKV